MRALGKLTLGVSLALLLTLGLAAADAPPRPRLGLAVTPGERTYLLQEPLSLTVTFANLGDQVVRVPHDLPSMSSDMLVVDIVSKYRERIGYRRIAEATTMYPSSYRGVEIPPGGKHTVWLDLGLQGRGEPVWIVPGDYTISVRYSWQNDAAPLIAKVTAQSEPVAVTVRKPTGREAKAYVMMRAAPDWKRPVAAVAHYRRLMALYPGTRWARWAHLRLAGVLEYGLPKESGGGHAVAIREYRKIAASYPGFPYVDWARFCVATRLEENGQLREALDEVGRLLRRAGFPDSLKALLRAGMRMTQEKLLHQSSQ